MRTKDQTRLIGVVAGGITSVLAITLAGCTAGEPDADAAPASPAPTSAAPSPSPTKTEGAGPQYSPEEQAAIDAAEAAVLRFNEVDEAALGDPASADPAAFDAVAIDPVRSEYNGLLREFREEGIHQTGKSIVTFNEVSSVSIESDPDEYVYPKVIFDACLDISKVDLVDESGTSVQGDGSDYLTGVAGVYEEPGQGWFVEYWEFQSDGGEACAP